jgi:hypothetical protein
MELGIHKYDSMEKFICQILLRCGTRFEMTGIVLSNGKSGVRKRKERLNTKRTEARRHRLRRQINANEERKFKKQTEESPASTEWLREGEDGKPDRPLRVTPSAAPV